jgi:DNA-binding response OmpR family regulator
MTQSILVVEDDKGQQKYLCNLLRSNGFVVQITGNNIRVLNILQKTQPDLVVLDLTLPNMSGRTVYLEIRKKYKDLPIIVLISHNNASDIISGLNLSTDYYITKPFITNDFLACINARLRFGKPDTVLKVADLEFNNKTLEVKRNGISIQLTPQELKLLQYLMNNKGRVLSRKIILNRIWLYSSDVETRVIDVYMGYLRKKIDHLYDKKLFHSIRGFGYVIKE